MTTTHNIEVQQAIHQAATEVAALEFIGQEAARQISPVAEAVANMFTILYYQAETVRATPEDFEQALDTIRQVTSSQGKRC
jgi:hypothetical protein